MTDAVHSSPRVHVRTASPPTKLGMTMSREATERMMNLVSPIVLLAIWEICARLGFIDVRFFPPPSKIFRVMWNMIENGLLKIGRAHV